jgi:hypothetical protein
METLNEWCIGGYSHSIIQCIYLSSNANIMPNWEKQYAFPLIGKLLGHTMMFFNLTTKSVRWGKVFKIKSGVGGVSQVQGPEFKPQYH